MVIEIDPMGKVYNDLLDLAFNLCDEFIFVIRDEFNISDNVNQIIEKLQFSLKNVKEQFDWPGTTIVGKNPALVYYYFTDPDAKEIIKQASNSFRDWIYPDLPEYLCFLKNNVPWLMNITHEHETYIITEDSEEIAKLSEIEGLSSTT